MKHLPAQRGVMLLEVLIAIVVFSIGVLSIVKLQAYAVKQSTDAEFRSMASLLASDLVSRMWTSDRSLTSLQAKFGSGNKGPGYNAWYKTVSDSGLPQVAAAGNLPTVEITDSKTLPGAAEARIELFWQAPGKDEKKHAYLTIVVLK